MNAPTCQHCGGKTHENTVCPRIKAIEYYPRGGVKRVEYLTPRDYNPTEMSALTFPGGEFSKMKS